MHFGAQILQPLLVGDAEMLLLVDHDQSEILELDGLAEHRMGADDNVDRALGEPLLDLALLGGADHARELADARPAGRRTAAMKFLECWRASKVVGTTIAVCLPLIAAAKAARSATSVLPKPTSPQTSRSIGRPEVRSSSVASMAFGLVLRLVIGEARAEFVVEPFGRRAGAARRASGARAATRISRPPFRARASSAAPCASASRSTPSRSSSLGVLRAVARQKLEVFDRQEQPVAAGVVDFQAIMRRARRLDRLQADEAPDAVIDMHDQIARRQRGGFGQHILGAPLVLALAHQAVAENVLLADDREVVGLETLLQRDHRQRQRAGARRFGLRQEETSSSDFRPCSASTWRQAFARAVASSRRRSPAGRCSRSARIWATAASNTLTFSSCRSGAKSRPTRRAAIDGVGAPGGAAKGARRASGAAARRAAPLVLAEIEPVRLQRPIIGLGGGPRHRRGLRAS